MTTKEIQAIVGRTQVLKFHNPVCENVKYLINDFELDVISISKSGMLYEFEVKISRGDFKADLKKRKHFFYTQVPERGPNYFSYVCPDGLIKKSEIGSGIGLYYAKDGELIEIQAPKRLHKIIHDKEKILEKVCRVMSERHFLGSCRMTFENKEHVARVAKYFKPVIGGPAINSFDNKNQIQMSEENQRTENLTFGHAIQAAKEGKLIARKGWKGKGMFVFMRPGDELDPLFIIEKVKSLPDAYKETLKNVTFQEGEKIKFTPYLCMKAADNTIVNGWLASQTDMLSNDWCIL